MAGLALGIVAAGAPASDLPPRLNLALHEVLVEQIGTETWTRFRFIAPEIDRTRTDAPSFAELEGDFPELCASRALPYLDAQGLEADKVVISIADRVVEFGVTDPEATQYFEQFRIEDGECIWEGF